MVPTGKKHRDCEGHVIRCRCGRPVANCVPASTASERRVRSLELAAAVTYIACPTGAALALYADRQRTEFASTNPGR